MLRLIRCLWALMLPLDVTAQTPNQDIARVKEEVRDAE